MRKLTSFSLLATALSLFLLSGCSSDDGADGAPGVDGTDGVDANIGDAILTTSGFALPSDAIFIAPAASNGDNITDDINLAIFNAFTSGNTDATFVLPKGTFIVDDTITITNGNGLTLTGYGINETKLDFTYQDSQVANQLSYWAEGGILEDLPIDMSTVMKTALFDDTVVATALTSDVLNDTAKAYLDINCAHCHRNELTLGAGYSGPAGSSGLQVEYNRPYADNPAKFGTCKVAVAGGDNNYPYDVIPKSPESSYLLFRMNTNDSRHRMPELGRATIHTEGVALISAWIDNLPNASCTPP